MFGTQHTLKQLFGGIAIAAFLAVVAVPSAFAGSFITDTLGGNGYPKATPDVFERAVARHEAWQVRAQQARSQAQGMRFITDTLGGNGYPKATPDVFERAVAIHEALQAQAQVRAVLLSQKQAQGMRFITDTLGGNGHPATKPSGYNPGGYVNGGMSPEVAKSIQAHRYDPSAYVNGGATPAVAQAIQDLGNGVTSAPSVTGGSSGTSFNWSDAGIGAGLAAGLLLLLAWGARLRTHNRRGVLTV